jgi:hypothetical protein
MMFQSKIVSENKGDVQKVCIFDDEHRLSFGETLELWRGDKAFREFTIGVLKNAPYESFRWEMPPVTLSTLNRDFEFVIIDSPYLPQSGDPRPFGDFFKDQKQSDGVVVFPNLGKDAMMIVPTPGEDLNAYAHMASFTRQAPDRQIHALFTAIGETMHQFLGDENIWLNTAGGGVAWLHVRLDSFPKYYRYNSYRENAI